MSYQPTISLDLDGVLASYTGWKGEGVIGYPYPGTQEFLEVLCELNYKLVIHTTRNPAFVQQWLQVHGLEIYFDDVTNKKPLAFLHIDDRAIRHDGDFQKTLYAVESFKVWWEKENAKRQIPIQSEAS